MPKRDEKRIERERADLISMMRPGDSLWECPSCRVQVLVEGQTEFRATCKSCEKSFVSVQVETPPARRQPRGH